LAFLEEHMLQIEKDRLVRKQEVLERLGISESTYFRLIRARVLPVVVVGRQSFRVRESALCTAIKNGLPYAKQTA
jgi:excisionase family DNA binding protein